MDDIAKDSAAGPLEQARSRESRGRWRSVRLLAALLICVVGLVIETRLAFRAYSNMSSVTEGRWWAYHDVFQYSVFALFFLGGGVAV